MDTNLYDAAGSFETKMAGIFEHLKKFAKDEHMSLHMSGLTRSLLRFPDANSFPAGSLEL